MTLRPNFLILFKIILSRKENRINNIIDIISRINNIIDIKSIINLIEY